MRLSVLKFLCIGICVFECSLQGRALWSSEPHSIQETKALAGKSGYQQRRHAIEIFFPNFSQGYTLIDSQWILTTASNAPYVGNILNIKDHYYKVEKFIPHPKYNFQPYKQLSDQQKKDNLQYDVMLGLLEEPVLNVQPVQRYRGRTELGATVWIMGGRTSELEWGSNVIGVYPNNAFSSRPSTLFIRFLGKSANWQENARNSINSFGRQGAVDRYGVDSFYPGMLDPSQDLVDLALYPYRPTTYASIATEEDAGCAWYINKNHPASDDPPSNKDDFYQNFALVGMTAMGQALRFFPANAVEYDRGSVSPRISDPGINNWIDNTILRFALRKP